MFGLNTTAHDVTPSSSTYTAWLLTAVSCALIVLYLYLLHHAIGDGRYLPTWSDEFEYQKNMVSFVRNHNLVSALALEENYARIFGASGHGFAYSLTNGLLAKILGPGSGTIIGINFLLIGATLLLVWMTKFLAFREKAFITAALLLFNVVMVYSFSYLMEMYQLFFGVALALTLVALSSRVMADKPANQLLILFYLLVTVATVYRQTWAIWGIALLPLAKSRRQFALFSALFLLLLLFSYLFSAYFLAPYPYDPRTYIFHAFAAGDITKGMALIGKTLQHNINLFFSIDLTAGARIFFFDHTFITRMSIVGLSLYFTAYGILRKSRYHLLAALVAWAHLLPVFLLFTTEASAMQRHLAPLYYLGAIFLVVGRNRADRIVLAALFLIQACLLLPVVTYTRTAVIQPKKILSAYHANSSTMLTDISGMLAENIREKSLTTLYIANDIPPLNLSVLLFSLPVRTAGGTQLRYTMNPFGQNIRLWHRVNVSYLLLPDSAIITDPAVEFVATAHNISLYRVLSYPDQGLIRQMRASGS